MQKRTFNFFWETAEPETGLIPDRWPRPPFSSIAAVGFALNAYAIGVERGWITRKEGRERALAVLQALASGGLPKLVDDIAYGCGVWKGVLTERELGALLPRFPSWPGADAARASAG